jgi:lipoprotein-anchoring transpeptidase ErfK/SrfK
VGAGQTGLLHNGEGYVVRGMHKAVIGSSVLVLAAGAILTTQLVTQARAERVALTAPATSSTASTTTTTTTTTVAPTTTTTTPPPPAPPPPPATTRPKPTTTTAKPKPRPQPQPVASGTPCIAAARACVDLSANRSWLMDGAGHVTYGPVPITSGRPGYRTPTGTFRVQWKDIDHLSSEFDNAPMPYSVFFNGGIAFHAGSLSVPSHGCIHLSLAAAQTYFNRLRVGDIVQVVS